MSWIKKYYVVCHLTLGYFIVILKCWIYLNLSIHSHHGYLKKKHLYYLCIMLCGSLFGQDLWFLLWCSGPFSCGMWDPVLWPRIEPVPPALGARGLSHWTNREVTSQWLLDFVSYLQMPTLQIHFSFNIFTFK